MDMENIIGLMVEVIKVNGKIIICMVMVFIYGLMADVMKANIKMIKNM